MLQAQRRDNVVEFAVAVAEDQDFPGLSFGDAQTRVGVGVRRALCRPALSRLSETTFSLFERPKHSIDGWSIIDGCRIFEVVNRRTFGITGAGATAASMASGLLLVPGIDDAALLWYRWPPPSFRVRPTRCQPRGAFL